MPFIEEILKHKSLSIVGLEKNTGKTECLNYILDRLKISNKRIAVTSIGVDGESSDILNNTKKPEIELGENIIFITSEKHYNQKTLTAEILDVSTKKTSLGRLVTARSLTKGKIIFSGPSDTHWLRSYIDKMGKYNVDTTIVDGALFRISLASPSITDCMILTTGASVSQNLPQLVKKTKFVYDLIKIPAFEQGVSIKLTDYESGIYAVDYSGEIIKLDVPSSFVLEKYKDVLFRSGNVLYFPGMISDKLLIFLKSLSNIVSITIIIRDFTRLFVSREVLNDFTKRGGKIFVLYKPKLIAVCINPQSPDGYKIESSRLQSELSAELEIPVYNIKNIRL